MTKFGVIAQNCYETHRKHQKNPTVPNYFQEFVSDFVVQLLGSMSFSVCTISYYLMNISNADQN
jgi:hypothetical protein